jgi:hypothetical protein
MVFGSRRDPLHPELAKGMKTTKRWREVNEEEEKEEGVAPLKSRDPHLTGGEQQEIVPCLLSKLSAHLFCMTAICFIITITCWNYIAIGIQYLVLFAILVG